VKDDDEEYLNRQTVNDMMNIDSKKLRTRRYASYHTESGIVVLITWYPTSIHDIPPILPIMEPGDKGEYGRFTAY